MIGLVSDNNWQDNGEGIYLYIHSLKTLTFLQRNAAMTTEEIRPASPEQIPTIWWSCSVWWSDSHLKKLSLSIMYKYLPMICRQNTNLYLQMHLWHSGERNQRRNLFLMQPNLAWILRKLCFWRESVYSSENNQYFCGEFMGRKSWVKFCSWRKILGMKGSHTDEC